MTASSMATRGNLRRQAVKSSAGVSDQFGFSSGVGQFCKRSLRSAAKAGPSPRLLLTSCIGRSLAMLMLSSSAIGNASRRNAVSCPCEASRANNFLAGRSHAAILFCRHARARSARTGNAVTVRAARGAKRRDPCRMGHHFFLGAPAVCIDGLVSFDDFGMSGSDLRNL